MDGNIEGLIPASGNVQTFKLKLSKLASSLPPNP